MMRLRRTTITIPLALLNETLRVSGRKKLSEAIVVSLEDYMRLKKKSAFVQELFDTRLPHRLPRIKAARKSRSWS